MCPKPMGSRARANILNSGWLCKERDPGGLGNTWLESMGSGGTCSMVRACRSTHRNIGYMRYSKCMGIGCLGHMDMPKGGRELGPHFWAAWDGQASVQGPG